MPRTTTYASDRGCAPFDVDEARRLYPDCPERFLEGIAQYVNGGMETGSFLRAVLENDLCGAVARASGSESMFVLPSICGIIVFCVPEQAHGSKAAVADWLSPSKTPKEDLIPAAPPAPDEA